MPNYKGKRPGTRRIVIYVKGVPKEKTITATKTEGDLFEGRWRVELEANKHDTRIVPTFGKLLTEKYSPFAAVNLAKSTWTRRRHLLGILGAFFGAKKLTEITGADTEAYKAERRAEKVAPRTINYELRLLLTVLKWAQKNAYLVTFPPVRYFRVPKGRPRIWTRLEVAKLVRLAAAEYPEVYRFVVFLVNTGCRKGEALAAEWSWMDFKRGMIRIPATEAWSPKDGEAREVPMSDECRRLLEIPKDERRSARWVFTSRINEQFLRFPDAIFKQLQTKAGITGGAHTLRHCFASFYLEKRPDLPALAKLLGHSTTRTTELYAHLLPDHLEQSRNAVNIGLARPPKTMVSTMGRREKTRKIA